MLRAFRTVALGLALAACGRKRIPDPNPTPNRAVGSALDSATADAASADAPPPRSLSRSGFPTGPFVTFIHDDLSCALRRDGTIACFEDGAPKRGLAPAGKFKTLVFDGSVGCAIRESGRVACFGDTTRSFHPTIAKPPAITVRDISSHDGLLCWIDERGAIGCSSTTDNKALVPIAKPEGDFVQLSCGWHSCCALTRAGELHCFGEPNERTTPPSGRFAAVAVETGIASDIDACALTTAGDIVSWGSDPTGTLHFPTVAGPFARITLDKGRVCALRADGTGECFSHGCGGQQPDFPGCIGDTFELPGAFAYFSYDCGVDLAGELACLSPRD